MSSIAPAVHVRAGRLAHFGVSANDPDAWSAGTDMQSCYAFDGQDLLDRKAMLEGVTATVVEQLALPDGPADVIDLGCGTGAAVRDAFRRYPRAAFVGVDALAANVDEATARGREAGILDRATFLLEDYCKLSFPAWRFDGAYAIDSVCYAPGRDKTRFLREARRVLAPGARLVIGDTFLRDDRPVPGFLAASEESLSGDWRPPAFASLPAFTALLRALGFRSVTVADASAQLTPSASQLAAITAGYKAASEKPVGPVHWQYARSPLLALGGLAESLGYYIVTACR